MSRFMVGSVGKGFVVSEEKKKSPDSDHELEDVFAEAARKAKLARLAEFDRKMKIIRAREREYFKNPVLPANGIET